MPLGEWVCLFCGIRRVRVLIDKDKDRRKSSWDWTGALGGLVTHHSFHHTGTPLREYMRVRACAALRCVCVRARPASRPFRLLGAIFFFFFFFLFPFDRTGGFGLVREDRRLQSPLALPAGFGLGFLVVFTPRHMHGNIIVIRLVPY